MPASEHRQVAIEKVLVALSLFDIRSLASVDTLVSTGDSRPCFYASGKEKTRLWRHQRRGTEQSNAQSVAVVTLTYDKKEGGGIRELAYPGTVESLAKSVAFGILGAWARITVLFIICVTLESH